MERIDTFSAETREHAHKLLGAGLEMLHRFPEEPSSRFCHYCFAPQVGRAFNEECPALLRCALNIASTRNNIVEPAKGCGVCGCRLVKIRGRYPRDPERTVCPTCCAERLDQINHISSRDYGVAAQATVAPESLIEAVERLSSERSDADGSH